jgi:hypothetical protein
MRGLALRRFAVVCAVVVPGLILAGCENATDRAAADGRQDTFNQDSRIYHSDMTSMSPADRQALQDRVKEMDAAVAASDAAAPR